MSEGNLASASGSKIARLGGALGIAGTVVGVSIFMGGCMGVFAAFTLSMIPLIIGVVGLICSIVGGVIRKHPSIEDTHVLASIFINVGVIAGALLEIMIWKGVPMFSGGAAAAGI